MSKSRDISIAHSEFASGYIVLPSWFTFLEQEVSQGGRSYVEQYVQIRSVRWDHRRRLRSRSLDLSRPTSTETYMLTPGLVVRGRDRHHYRNCQSRQTHRQLVRSSAAMLRQESHPW